jgi:hypothetical protein
VSRDPIYQVAAAWCVPDKLTFGGHLALTDAAIEWTPTQRNADLGARPWSAPLGDVREVGKSRRTWNLFDGGLRVRLRIVMRDDSEVLFVVNKLDDVLAALEGVVFRGRRL